ALSFHDVFVLFNENSGAPLGTAKEQPLVLPISFTAAPKGGDTLTLTLEPGPSLVHTQDCRWFFVPFIVPGLQSTPVEQDAEQPDTR
ncbi:MAG TPA: hypothetical protein VFG50_13790, partial [Rhodothermales bacterium]|nr:hypothetical protein [Rhodothermales bacterium]